MSWQKSLSRVWLFETPWTVAYQALLPMEISRQEYWGGLPFPTPEHLPDPGSERKSLPLLHRQVDSLPLHHLGSPLSTTLVIFQIDITLKKTIFLLSAFPAKSFANILWFFFPPPKNILNMKSIFVGIMLPSNPKRTMTMCSIDFWACALLILWIMASFWDQGHQWQPRWRWGMGLQKVIVSHVRPPAMSVLSFQWVHGVLIQSCHLLLSHIERQKLNLSDVIFHWVSGCSPGSISLNPESLY